MAHDIGSAVTTDSTAARPFVGGKIELASADAQRDLIPHALGTATNGEVPDAVFVHNQGDDVLNASIWVKVSVFGALNVDEYRPGVFRCTENRSSASCRCTRLNYGTCSVRYAPPDT